ncbi:MAG: HEAT repeat domain-containing protein [Candidatus Riflebacteria bacterium]|nr:HEAT repeat domain-containing protein [Candidatus Riflebacteria bacterium]
MRRQDEIRLLLPSLNAASQKLLLSELDGYARSYDAEETHELLWSLASHAVDLVRHQALVTLSLFMPRFLAARMGALGQLASPWSAFRQGEASAPPPISEDPARLARGACPAGDPVRDRMRRTAVRALVPLARSVASRLPELSGPLLHTAKLALAFLGSDAALDALIDDVRSHRGGFESLWAFAFGGGAGRDARLVLEILRRHGGDEPDTLLAAIPLDLESIRQVGAALRGRLDWLGVSNLAIALARQPDVDPVLDLDPLLQGASGWAQVYALRALAFSRKPTALPVIERTRGAATHPFVRQQAIRAAAGIGTADALLFCLECARQGQGHEVAQAIESLVALKCPGDKVAEVAAPHVASADLSLRVRALLATVEPPGPWPASFIELLKSADPLPRLEAAFCLGYWPSQRALKILALQATSDEHPAVRQQAIKSLSKFPTAQAIPMLTHLIKTSAPPEAQTALRVMARSAADSPGGVAEFLLRELAAQANRSRHAMLIRALASHAAATGQKTAEAALIQALGSGDRPTLCAALEGFKELAPVCGDAARGILTRLMDDPRPDVWGAAAVASFLAGELSAIDRIEAHLASRDPDRISRAVLAFTELALLGTEVIGPQHRGLATALEPGQEPSEPEVTPPRVTRRFLPAVAGQPGAPAQDEGELWSPSAGEPDRSADPAPEAPDEMAETGVFDEVKRCYEAPRPERPGLAPRLAAVSHLAVNGQAATGLARESTAAVWARRARRTALLLHRNRLLMLSLAALLGLALWLVRTGPVPTAAVRPPTTLAVARVTGRATGDETGALLAAGDVVHAGQNLRTGPAASISLLTDGGDRISVGPESRMGLDLVGPRGELAVVLVEGTAEIEPGSGRTAGVTWHDFRLEASGSGVGLEASVGQLVVRPHGPGVRLYRPGESPNDLVPDREVSLP